jgi:hypothetical protein
MTERSEDEPRNEGVEEDVQSQGGEGERASAASPPIGEDADRERTQSPAPDDETGVPSDAEISDEEAG